MKVVKDTYFLLVNNEYIKSVCIISKQLNQNVKLIGPNSRVAEYFRE